MRLLSLCRGVVSPRFTSYDDRGVSRPDLPSGTVTFLFTDVEGSTRLLQEHGAAYADLLAEHRRALREAFARHDGVEVDTQGDAFFVAFARAADAVAAAAEARQRRSSEARSASAWVSTPASRS